MDKLRWAFNLYDQERRGVIDLASLYTIIPLMDQVEQTGFMDGATDEQLDEINYRSRPDPFQRLDTRAKNVWDVCDLNTEGMIEIEEFVKVPERMIHAKAYD